MRGRSGRGLRDCRILEKVCDGGAVEMMVEEVEEREGWREKRKEVERKDERVLLYFYTLLSNSHP